ncbi:MAG: NifU N-terminal domain-containing protein [Acidobacteria bacterium]|nr:NifU N-terminal domain-containing protein [Acidobacteriota bacterium]
MPVTVSITPNDNARKFTVGMDVGGPSTFVPANAQGNELATALLGIEGTKSVFMSADFVTISKVPDVSWDTIEPHTIRILEAHFS